MKKYWLATILSILLISTNAFSQNSDMMQNLSRIKVEKLTDAQIKQLIDQMESSGMTDSQLEQMALLRGMDPSQVRELRKRIEDYKMKGSSLEGQERTRGRLRSYSDKPDSIFLRQRGFDRIDMEEDKEEEDFFKFLLEDEEEIEVKLRIEFSE